MNNRNNTVIMVALAAALIALAAYLRSLSCGFVNWDDTDYILNNTGIRTLDRDFFVWAFTTIPYDFWLPLTWTSFAIDYHFWQLNPFGFHLTNILVHAASTGLVVLVTDRLFRDRFSGEEGAGPKYLYPAMLLLAGLLFGIHPLRVEAVAWVTERKGLLNGLFTLLSLLCYLRYVRKREAAASQGAAYGAYALSLLLFFVSLMAKPASVVLPAMLLVMDWYPLGRFKREKVLPLIVEKLPFLALSMAINFISIAKNAEVGTFNSLALFPLDLRAIATGNALFEYIRLTFWPVGILPFYNLPMLIPKVFIAKTVAVVCVLCACVYWGRRRPWLIAALLFFLIPLLTILPFLSNGASLALAARYTYLPALLPSMIAAVLIASGARKAARRWPRYGSLMVAGVVVPLLVFYVAMTQRLIGHWHDSGAMWSRVIEYQPFDRAYFYRGLYYTDSGNYAGAIDDYTTCITIAAEEQVPFIYNLYAFRAEALTKAGRFDEAVADLNVAISMFPHRLYFYHRGLAFKGLGRDREADEDFARAGRAKGQMHWFAVGTELS
jgi:protein O-mannosyl-transferase